MRAALKRLLPYLRPYRRQAFGVVVLGAVAAIGARISLVFFKPLVDRLGLPDGSGTPAEEQAPSGLDNWTENYLEPWLGSISNWGMPEGVSEVVMILLLMTALGLLFALVQFVFLRMSRMLAVYMITDVRQDMADHVVRLGMGYHSERRMGDLVSRLTTDVDASLRILSLMVEEIVQSPFAILASLALALAAEPVATLGMLILLPAIAYPVARIGPRIRRRARRTQDRLGDSTQVLTQMLSGIRVVKAFRMEEREAQEFKRVNKEFVTQTESMVKAQATSLAVTAFFANAGIGLVLAALALVHILYTPIFNDSGTMVVFFVAVGGLIALVKRLMRAITAIFASLGSVDRVFSVLDLEPEVKDAAGAKPFGRLQQGIRFEQVGFRYADADRPALADVNLDVKRGQRIALVGASGAGKSTMLDLVARFYDVSTGSLQVDGTELRELKHGDWLDRIAVVQQQPFLFQASLRENIRYGRPDATDEQILEACDAANLGDMLQQLPEGLDTQVGDAGARLSGGQAQRVTIARALLKDADVLLLDEATSALDSESERKVQIALDNLMTGRTTFVIAHRLGTIRGADCILVLEDGHIVESGSHEELLDANGSYAHMWHLQVGGPVEA